MKKVGTGGKRVKRLFLHRNLYVKLFEAAKIYVQILRFTCCLTMAYNLTKPIWALICLPDVTGESIVALTHHFADAFVR